VAGDFTTFQVRSAILTKLSPFSAEEPANNYILYEGLSEDLTITVQGFSNYEAIPNLQLQRQLRSYTAPNPDVEDLRQYQAILMACSLMPEIGTMFVYD